MGPCCVSSAALSAWFGGHKQAAYKLTKCSFWFGGTGHVRGPTG